MLKTVKINEVKNFEVIAQYNRVMQEKRLNYEEGVRWYVDE